MSETRIISVELLDAGERLIANARERMTRQSTSLSEARALAFLAMAAIRESIVDVRDGKGGGS